MAKLAAVHTSAPEPELAGRVEGAPAPAALESFAAFLLERLRLKPEAPKLQLVSNHADHHHELIEPL
jgi:hypothetical protein